MFLWMGFTLSPVFLSTIGLTVAYSVQPLATLRKSLLNVKLQSESLQKERRKTASSGSPNSLQTRLHPSQL